MKSIARLLTEDKMGPAYDLYCDMDGCLTDFDERFKHFTGVPPDVYEKTHSTEAFWNLIDIEIGIEFWSGMKWTPGGERLWNFIAPYGPTLLTSPSKRNESRLGKNIWVKDHLVPAPKVLFKYSRQKHEVAHNAAVHIDDRKDIIKRWNRAGGIGILCPKNGDTQVVIDRLKELGY